MAPIGQDGASGSTSMRVRWVPFGTETIVTMAWATLVGRRAPWWRRWPQRSQCGMTWRMVSSLQVVPCSVEEGPGRTMPTRTPVPSSSICMARAMPSRPALAVT